MQMLGDTVRSPFRHDAATLPIPAPSPTPMFRSMTPTGRWDAGVVFKASLQTGALCAMFTVPLTFPGWIPWYTPAAVLLMVPLPTWLGLSLWPRSVMSIIEKVVNQDLNGDNQIGEPEQEPTKRVEIEISQVNDKGRLTGIKALDIIGIDYDVLREFFIAVVGGMSLAGPSWSGETGKISQPKFTAMMRALERAGLVDPGHGNVARSLTRAGRAVLRRFT